MSLINNIDIFRGCFKENLHVTMAKINMFSIITIGKNKNEHAQNNKFISPISKKSG